MFQILNTNLNEMLDEVRSCDVSTNNTLLLDPSLRTFMLFIYILYYLGK